MTSNLRRLLAIGIGLVTVGALVYALPSLQREMKRRTIRAYVHRIMESTSIPPDRFEVSGTKPERLDYLVVGADGGNTIVVSTDTLRELREGRGLRASLTEETFGFCLIAAQTTLYKDLFVYYHPSGLPDGLGACAGARYLDVISRSDKGHRLYDLDSLALVAAWEAAR